MTSISTLRQIVTDIHSVAPQGLRKALRAELAEKVCKPNTLKKNEQSIKSFCWHSFMNFSNRTSASNNVNTTSKLDYTHSSTSDYIMKVYGKEQERFVKKTMKEIGARFTNPVYPMLETERKFTEVKFNILQGLMVSKKAGLKLPEIVELWKMYDGSGSYSMCKPKKIAIDPYQDELCQTAIHEIFHKNDVIGDTVAKIPILGLLAMLPSKLIPMAKKDLIKKEICNYAKTNREEFIACTGEKLLSEKKSWSDLDPKIKKLYDVFKGPKFKTN